MRRQRGGVGGWAGAWPAARLPERLRITSVIRQFGRRAPPPKMRIMPGRYTRAAVRGGGPAIAEAAAPPRSRA